MQINFSMPQVPEVVFDREPGFVRFYEAAWRLAAEHIVTTPGLPVPRHMDEAFTRERLWIWDSCFMTFYCRYAFRHFPGTESLDNFYLPMYDGVESPLKIHHPDNPPLFAWAEYESFKFTGDRQRIRRNLVEKRYLQRHYEFLENVRIGERFAHSFCLDMLQKNECGYLWSGTASGMDNTPRGNDIPANLYWMDILAQQALSALYISRLADCIGETAIATEYRERYDDKKTLLNRCYFDEVDGCYYDLHAATVDVCRVLTPASFWPLLAEVADESRAARQIAVLTDPEKLGGEFPIPSVARDTPYFQPDGCYWRGGVWMPTSYMVIKSLEKYGRFELAAELAERTIAGMLRVFEKYSPHTIWEAYAPCGTAPATGRRGGLVRPNFCGWSALGPIALLIENVIGIHEVDSTAGIIRCHRRRQGKHGVRNLCFGDFCCDIIFDDDEIEVVTNKDVTLMTQEERFCCRPGMSHFNIKQKELVQ